MPYSKVLSRIVLKNNVRKHYFYHPTAIRSYLLDITHNYLIRLLARLQTSLRSHVTKFTTAIASELKAWPSPWYESMMSYHVQYVFFFHYSIAQRDRNIMPFTHGKPAIHSAITCTLAMLSGCQTLPLADYTIALPITIKITGLFAGCGIPAARPVKRSAIRYGRYCRLSSVKTS